jgi:hypothetical protein
VAADGKGAGVQEAADAEAAVQAVPGDLEDVRSLLLLENEYRLSIYNPRIVYSGTDQMPRVLVNSVFSHQAPKCIFSGTEICPSRLCQVPYPHLTCLISIWRIITI